MKILVANRGEIAVRVMRSLKEMGIATIGIYSEADKECLHVKIADEAHYIGPAPAQKSYLAAEKIVQLAKQTNATGIHPGYGFLSENPLFASLCEQENLLFIGPTPENLKLAGDKREARIMVQKIGVPVTPGSDKPLTFLADAIQEADRIGYPLMLKAASGGGGRGMRIIFDKGALEDEFATAAAEARASFGDPTLYLEKYIERPRHIEVQVIGDGKGNAVHLMERNCSVQRRHQKLIEEAPSPKLDQAVRKSILDAAVKIARGLSYRNAGTIEFLLDGSNNYFFMELNARIQVEHPVTEMTTGIDLVKAQFSVATEKRLPFDQSVVTQHGHAIECRINAEDPEMEFLPSPGQVVHFQTPGGFGVRFDSHLYPGYHIPMYYDSLLGKLITWGMNRSHSIASMKRALTELEIMPIKTTKAFLYQVLNQDEFVHGSYQLDLVGKMVREN